MKHSVLAMLAFILMTCGVSSDTGINKNLFVADGEHKSSGLRSVNGSITVGNEARVDGDCTTVNGEIIIGENSVVGELSCVNGSISLDRSAKAKEVSCINGSIHLNGEVVIQGDISTVNGSITGKRDVEVLGDMATVNGDMSILQTLVAGNISTVNGDIELLESSLVKGDIIVNRDRKSNKKRPFKELIITVEAGSKVKGNIEVKGENPNVTVVLADGGEVLGNIINAEVIRK
jgi:DUF4097 and DUF4098 domain-containing protein YvlB